MIASGCQHAPGCLPIEQASPEGLFKRAYPAANRSVINPQLQCCGRKLTRAGNAQENAYVIPIHFQIDVLVHWVAIITINVLDALMIDIYLIEHLLDKAATESADHVSAPQFINTFR